MRLRLAKWSESKSGAPVTPEYAAEIGADGYAPDAGSAAVKAKELGVSLNDFVRNALNNAAQPAH